MNDPSAMPERRRPFKRWFAWRRVALLSLIVLIAAVGIGWIQYRGEKEAAMDIEAMGGIVRYWHHSIPTWVSDYTGEEVLKPISDVTIILMDVDGNLAGLDFERLSVDIRKFGKVRGLYLAGRKVDDSWLARLREPPNIVELVIEDTNISEDGLEYLKGWKSMNRLYLGGNPRLTDAALDKLKKLPRLKHLHVQDDAITDEGIRKLKKALPQLTTNRGI